MKTICMIAEVCKNARIRAGNTQRFVASVADCSTSAISKFEQGKRNNAEIFLVYLLLYPNLKEELENGL